MKHILFVFICLLFAGSGYSQSKYYSTFDDLQNDKGVECDISMRHLSAKKKKKALKPPYRISKAEDKHVRKAAGNAMFVGIGEDLFLNCKGIDVYCYGRLSKHFNKSRFVKCHRLGDNKVVFTMVDFGSGAARALPTFADRVVNGILTLLTSKEDLINDVADDVQYEHEVRRHAAKIRTCYVMYNDGRKRVERIDSHRMKVLLDTRLDLIEEYEALDLYERETPEVVYSFLLRSGQMK